MWWMDVLWGSWHGLTAWIVFVAHLFGGLVNHPLYDAARSGNGYDFGFLVGAGSPLLGFLNRGRAPRPDATGAGEPR
jgi:hypothetical protein